MSIFDRGLVGGLAPVAATFNITSVDGGGAILDLVLVTAGEGYMAGDTLVTLNGSVAGTGARLMVGSVGSAGEITGFAILDGGNLYVGAEVLTDATDFTATYFNGLDNDYQNHEEYEDGGVASEELGGTQSSYSPNALPTDFNGAVIYPYGGISGYEKDENVPNTKTVRLADQAQLIIQKRYIDGGSITVYAEPNFINGDGTSVGTEVRAEDINDEGRCEEYYFVATGGARFYPFKWVSSFDNGSGNGVVNEAGNRGNYGFCRAKNYYEITDEGSAVDQGCCPAGTKYSAVTVQTGGPGCERLTATEVNNVVTQTGQVWGDFGIGFAGMTQAPLQDAKRACELSGNHWNNYSNECIDTAVPSNFSIANYDFDERTFASSINDYLSMACRQAGYQWLKYTGECVADNSVASVATINGGVAPYDDKSVAREDCVAGGHIWIAGVCYEGNSFGDGHSRTPANYWYCDTCGWYGPKYDLERGTGGLLRCPICGELEGSNLTPQH